MMGCEMITRVSDGMHDAQALPCEPSLDQMLEGPDLGSCVYEFFWTLAAYWP